MPTFYESLPNDCPPLEASQVNEPTVVYRLVRDNPPTEEDFRSQRSLQPGKQFRNVTECQACGLSVHRLKSDSALAAKLPSLRGRQPCRVALDTGAGFLQQTGKPSHHTWWRLADYPVLEHCTVETL